MLDSEGSWHPARERWLAAATQLIEIGYGLERVREILEAINDDWTYSDKLLTVPDLLRHIHPVAKRAAHRARSRPDTPSRGTGDGFDAALAAIKALAGQHGRDGLAGAREQIAELGPRHERFVEAAGWRRICDATSFDERALRQIWLETTPAEAA